MGDEEDDTPRGPRPRRVASPEADTLNGICLALQSLTGDVCKTAGSIDGLEGAERSHLLALVAQRTGEVADTLHELRRGLQAV